MIIDIHSHIRRLGDNQKKAEEELLFDMQRNHVDFRVVSCLDGGSVEENNEYISAFVSRHPDKLAGCAVINPKEKDCVAQCEKALSMPGMKMIELQPLRHGYYPDHCEGVEEVINAAEKMGAAVKVFTGMGANGMPQQWIKHVERHPHTSFIFLHMGCFDYGYGCVDLASRYPNVYLETSNQYEVQILKKSISAAPREKLLFGSSYPERLTRCSLDVYDMFHMDEEWKADVFGGNADRLLHLWEKK
ncbi:MAG: amidohydrolase family protein [Eubacteriales bacterium]|nr:amidohydrolase family protein [Eubacteriales bacterium]